MRINPIKGAVSFKGSENCEKKYQFNKHDLIPATGYSSIGLGLVSGVLGSKKKITAHKVTAFASIGMAIGHVVLLKTLYRSSMSESNKCVITK